MFETPILKTPEAIAAAIMAQLGADIIGLRIEAIEEASTEDL